MNISRSILITIVATFAIAVSFVLAQPQETRAISNEEVQKTVREAIEKIEDYYVIKEKVPGFIAALKANLDAGRYDVTDVEVFIALLNEDLKKISNDRHMTFWRDPELNKAMHAAPDDSEENPELDAIYNAEALADNFGFASVDRLPGKIGYLEFISFWAETPGAEEKTRAAMELLHGSSAVIIDLRKNGGGHPWIGRLIQSYFFDKPTLVWRFYDREKDELTEGWTASPVPEKSLSEVPLYVLTSGRTASAAEEFAYATKAFKIGTVVGQRTVGAAYRTGSFPIGNDFILRISIAAPISPVTNGNWEGTGVDPDIKVDATDALLVAQIHALEVLKSERAGEDDVFDLDWALMEVRAQLSPPQLSERELKGFVGTYGSRKIAYEKWNLFYQLEDRAKVKLIPLTETVFKHPFRDYYRVRFLKDGLKTIAMEGLYDDGRVSHYERTGSSVKSNVNKKR